MKCSECGNEINVNETECKNCGCPVSEMNVNSNQEYINVNTNMNTDTIEKNKNQNIMKSIDNWLDKSIENNLNNSFTNKVYQGDESNYVKTKTERTIDNLENIGRAFLVFGILGFVIMLFVIMGSDEEFAFLYLMSGVAILFASVISNTLFQGLSSILANLYEINLKK